MILIDVTILFLFLDLCVCAQMMVQYLLFEFVLCKPSS
jgi:hypothetical protein